MKSPRSAVCRGCLKMLFSTPRFWAVLIVLALYLEGLFAPVRSLLIDMDLRVGLMGFLTYVLNDPTASAVIVLLFLALMFDVPATDELQRYYFLRTGRRQWARGQLMFVACAAVLYMLIIVLIAQLLILPWTEWTLSWSGGIRAFTDDFMYEVYDSMLEYDPWLTFVYAPAAAFSLELFLHILVLFMLGVLLMNINANIDRRIGFAVLVVPLMTEMILTNYFGDTLAYISPLSWCRLSGLDYGDGMGRPPVLYAVGLMLALSVLLHQMFLRFASRKELIA